MEVDHSGVCLHKTKGIKGGAYIGGKRYGIGTKYYYFQIIYFSDLLVSS
jgi:hypothetical protein